MTSRFARFAERAREHDIDLRITFQPRKRKSNMKKREDMKTSRMGSMMMRKTKRREW